MILKNILKQQVAPRVPTLVVWSRSDTAMEKPQRASASSASRDDGREGAGPAAGEARGGRVGVGGEGISLASASRKGGASPGVARRRRHGGPTAAPRQARAAA